MNVANRDGALGVAPVFYSIVSANYLAYAVTLMQTLRVNHPEAPRYVFLADEVRNDLDLDPDLFDLIPVRDLQIPHLEHFAFRYSVLEFNTAIKPFAMRWIAERHSSSAIAYIDPDIFVLTPLVEVLKATSAGALAVLTPHITAPISDGKHPDEVTFLRVGAYNLGFIATGPHPARKALLDWWSDRLEFHANVDLEAGLFTDQKWADLIPSLFADVHVLRHPGYDLAYWNLAQRPVGTRADGALTAAGELLSFVHFSGVDISHPDLFSVHQNRFDVDRIGELRPLYLRYLRLLQENGHDRFSRIAYSWARLRDGTQITREMRAIFRHRFDIGRPDASEDPFGLTRGTFSEGVSVTTRISRLLLRSYPRLRALRPIRWAMTAISPKTRWVLRRYLTRRSTSPSLLQAEADRDRSTAYATSRPNGLERRPSANVIGYFKGEFGVAEAGRAFVMAAQAGDVEVALINVDAPASGRAEDHRMSSLTADVAQHSVNVLCVNADQTPKVVAMLGPRIFASRYNIGFWFWELARFPDAWQASIESVDEIWTASEFVAGAVARATSKPVRIVRLPVDATPSRVYDRAEFGIPDDAFTFLFSFDFGSYEARKNPRAVVTAFQSAFPAGDLEVRLFLKATNGRANRSAMSELRSVVANDQRILLVDAFMSRDQMYGLESVADSYVSLHRSEGLGLGLAESMFLGKPVIGTAYSGNMEFMDARNSCLVGYDLVDVRPGEYPFSDGQVWADPDLEQAAWYMQRLVRDPAFASEIGARARAHMQSEFSKRATGARMNAELCRIRNARISA